MKKTITRCVLLISVVLLCCGCTPSMERLQIDQLATANANNVLVCSDVQYSGVWMVYADAGMFGTRLCVCQNGRQVDETSYDYGFQLWDEQLYFLKNDGLYRWQLGETITKEQLVQQPLLAFTVGKQGLIYEDMDGQWFFLQQGERRPITCDETIHYVAFGEEHVFILASEHLYRCSPDLSGQERFALDLEGLNVGGLHGQLLVVDDQRVMIAADDVFLFDLGTGQKTTLFERSGLDNVTFNANGDCIVLSYQAQAADGSLVWEEKHPDNGLWRIDANTLEKNKLSDTVAISIYFYNEHKLLLNTRQGVVWQDL